MERSVHFQQTGISTRFTPQLEDLADQVSCLLHAIRELTITTNANDATADTVRELFDAFKQALIDNICNEFRKTSNPKCWQDYVHLYVLPNLFGFELLPVPYIIAHLKLAIQLAALDIPEPERQRWTYRFQHNEQPNIYLTNT